MIMDSNKTTTEGKAIDFEGKAVYFIRRFIYSKDTTCPDTSWDEFKAPISKSRDPERLKTLCKNYVLSVYESDEGNADSVFVYAVVRLRDNKVIKYFAPKLIKYIKGLKKHFPDVEFVSEKHEYTELPRVDASILNYRAEEDEKYQFFLMLSKLLPTVEVGTVIFIPEFELYNEKFNIMVYKSATGGRRDLGWRFTNGHIYGNPSIDANLDTIQEMRLSDLRKLCSYFKPKSNTNLVEDICEKHLDYLSIYEATMGYSHEQIVNLRKSLYDYMVDKIEGHYWMGLLTESELDSKKRDAKAKVSSLLGPWALLRGHMEYRLSQTMFTPTEKFISDVAWEYWNSNLQYHKQISKWAADLCAKLSLDERKLSLFLRAPRAMPSILAKP